MWHNEQSLWAWGHRPGLRPALPLTCCDQWTSAVPSSLPARVPYPFGNSSQCCPGVSPLPLCPVWLRLSFKVPYPPCPRYRQVTRPNL